MASFENEELVPHFIYCGEYYCMSERVENFKKMFLAKMKNFEIQSSILTMIEMYLRNHINKEKVKEASEGKLKNEKGWEYKEVSINDDLEIFFKNILKERNEKRIWSFFRSKLTKEELELVQFKSEDHLNTDGYHYAGQNPYVNVERMKKSDSKSKYVNVVCRRLTFTLTLERNKRKAMKKYCEII